VSRDSEHLELNKKKWDRRSRTYDEKRFGYFRFFQRRVISLVDPRKGGRLLDIGCGTGWAVRRAAGLVGKEGEACGVDISPGMIERAKTNVDGLRNVRLYLANAEALPFEDDYFDYVICTQSFHHYLKPSKVLGEICRVLKPGGRAYIMDPTADSFIVRWADRRSRKKEPEHVRLYSTAEFREMFARAGLKPVKVKTILPFMKVHVGEK
jgi:ubiquinone/menaquinone biosynthesis C-methylase UbiE